jgi:uncharacterized membrane protein
MLFQDGIDIDAPIDRVWAVYTDVERWPEWTQSVRSATRLTDGPFAIDAKVRIDQPKLAPMTWTVTELVDGTSWTWVAKSFLLGVVGRHELRATGPATTRVDQSIDMRGPLSGIVGRLARSTTNRYLAMEAAGLKARVERGA